VDHIVLLVALRRLRRVDRHLVAAMRPQATCKKSGATANRLGQSVGLHPPT
jgi:hypothetical protein